MDLTDTQQAILALIADTIAAEGLPPSQTEIARAFGFKSVRAAQYHLEALEQAGAIERLPGKMRGIRVLVAPPAGDIPAVAANDDQLDKVFFSPAPDYLLKVQGDSMIDEGIFDGDLIGVHRTRDARSGQIVVARIDEEITVKLLKMGKDRIRLLPRNPDYAPIEVLPDQDFAIEGLYCGLLRPNR